jgi:zinc transport system substrate-binding protein
MRNLCAIAAAVTSLVLCAACGGSDDAPAERKVAVSIFPIYDIARRVAGDRLEVVLVLPPGRSEHGYEPTPREMAAVSGSSAGFVVGLEMDPWAERIIRSAAGSDVRIVELGEALDPRRPSEVEIGEDIVEHAHEHAAEEREHHEGEEHEGEEHEGEEHEGEEHEGEGEHAEEHHEGEAHEEEGEHHEGEEHEGEGEHHAEEHHHHGAYDPHFWLDPVRMQRAVDRFVAEFSRLDPDGAAGYRERGERTKRELTELHERIEARSRAWQRRTIVTFHGSFGYFADRYDLHIAAVIEPFPGREPTPRYMQEVITAIRASGASALFSEPQLDPRPARVVAEQAGVRLFSLDPVGGTREVDTYERLMLANTTALDRALGAR